MPHPRIVAGRCNCTMSERAVKAARVGEAGGSSRTSVSMASDRCCSDLAQDSGLSQCEWSTLMKVRTIKIAAFLITGGMVFATSGCLHNWFVQTAVGSLVFDGVSHLVSLNVSK